MVRTQISLTPEQHRQLAALSASTGRSMSDLIRGAVDAVFGQQHALEDDLEAIQAGFGAWHGSDAGGSGATYVEQLRSGKRLTRT